MQRSNVDFPPPEGPTTAVIRPASKLALTRSRTARPAKALQSSTVSIHRAPGSHTSPPLRAATAPARTAAPRVFHGLSRPFLVGVASVARPPTPRGPMNTKVHFRPHVDRGRASARDHAAHRRRVRGDRRAARGGDRRGARPGRAVRGTEAPAGPRPVADHAGSPASGDRPRRARGRAGPAPAALAYATTVVLPADGGVRGTICLASRSRPARPPRPSSRTTAPGTASSRSSARAASARSRWRTTRTSAATWRSSGCTRATTTTRADAVRRRGAAHGPTRPPQHRPGARRGLRPARAPLLRHEAARGRDAGGDHRAPARRRRRDPPAVPRRGAHRDHARASCVRCSSPTRSGSSTATSSRRTS